MPPAKGLGAAPNTSAGPCAAYATQAGGEDPLPAAPRFCVFPGGRESASPSGLPRARSPELFPA
eukprot:8155685-Alexandrium_andersonii.AAC.1